MRASGRIFFERAGELEADLALWGSADPNRLLLLRRGHPALSAKLQLVTSTDTHRWSGEYAAAVLTAHGALRIAPNGEVEALEPLGRVRRIAAAPAGFGPRVGGAACLNRSEDALFVVGGEVDGHVTADVFQFDLRKKKWTVLGTRAPKQMHGELLALSDGALVLAGGFMRYPDRGGDVAALFRGGRWTELAVAAANKQAAASQLLFEHAATGRVLFARAHGFAPGRGEDDVKLYLLSEDGVFEEHLRVKLPDNRRWRAVALAWDAEAETLFAVGQSGDDDAVTEYRAPLAAVLKNLRPARLSRVTRARPKLPAKLPGLVTLTRTDADADLVAVIARDGVVKARQGAAVKHVKDRDPRAAVEALLHEGYRFEELPPEDVFALLTPTSARTKPPPRRAIVQDRHGARKVGGKAPDFPRGRWPACEGCEQPLRFLADFGRAEVGLAHHAAVLLFACSECQDPASAVALLHRESPVQWPKAARIARPLPAVRVAFAAPSSQASSRIGGKPQFLQSEPEVPPCKHCGAQQRFVLQIDSSLNGSFPFGDGGRGYLFVCPFEHGATFTFDGH